MDMRNIIVFIIFILVGVQAFTSGKKDSAVPEQKPAEVFVSALAGPSGIGMAGLFRDPPVSGDTRFVMEIAGSVDVLLPKLVKGEVDIGILPPNVAAKIWNTDRSLVMAAVVGNGMISLVTRDPAVSNFSSLSGKTVSVAGQGATPEFTARALLQASGMSPDSVVFDFSIPTPELAAALVSGRIGYVILPEPFSTVAVMNGTTGNQPVRKAIDFQKEWTALGLGASYPMTVCVVRREFAEKHPDLVRVFLDSYKASIEWVNAEPVAAGQAVEEAGLGLRSPIVARSIPAANLVFIPAFQARADLESLLSVFLAYAPASAGGKLPDDGFYFK